MRFKVYHNKNPHFDDMEEAPEFNEGNFELVAEVECKDHEEGFELTNSINSPWWKNCQVTCIKKTRSTSVGDVLISQEGIRYLCKRFGWFVF